MTATHRPPTRAEHAARSVVVQQAYDILSHAMDTLQPYDDATDGRYRVQVNDDTAAALAVLRHAMDRVQDAFMRGQ